MRLFTITGRLTSSNITRRRRRLTSAAHFQLLRPISNGDTSPTGKGDLSLQQLG